MSGNQFGQGLSVAPQASWPKDEVLFLQDSSMAAEFLRDCRWKGGYYCPRCRSVEVGYTNSFVYRELLRCSECKYSFNVTSMTVFHGSKLPLNRHLQLLIAIDLFRDRLDAREIGKLVDTSERTVKLHLERSWPNKVSNDYLRLRTEPDFRFGSLMVVLEKAGAALNATLFRRRVSQWLGCQAEAELDYSSEATAFA